MKEFNLEEAKAGKPVYTRDGRPARIICWDRKSYKTTEYHIVALIKTEIDEEICTYTKQGYSSSCRGKDDLMMAGGEEGRLGECL